MGALSVGIVSKVDFKIFCDIILSETTSEERGAS